MPKGEKASHVHTDIVSDKEVARIEELFGTEEKNMLVAIGMLIRIRREGITIDRAVKVILEELRFDDHYHAGINKAGEMYRKHREEFRIE